MIGFDGSLPMSSIMWKLTSTQRPKPCDPFSPRVASSKLARVKIGISRPRLTSQARRLPGSTENSQLGNPRRKREGDLRRARLGDQRIEVVAIAKPLVAPVAGDGCGLRAAGAPARPATARSAARVRLRPRGIGLPAAARPRGRDESCTNTRTREADLRQGNLPRERSGDAHEGLVTPRTASQRITPSRWKTNGGLRKNA